MEATHTSHPARTTLIIIGTLIAVALVASAIVFIGALFLFSIGADRDVIESGLSAAAQLHA